MVYKAVRWWKLRSRLCPPDNSPLTSSPFEKLTIRSNVHDRSCRTDHEPKRPARPCRTIQRLAVRAGEGDRCAAEEAAEGRGAVRDRLRTVGTAAYRYLWRSRAHHHGAPCLSRADRGQDQDPPAGLLRRHGWAA